jgi:hypothetical protein
MQNRSAATIIGTSQVSLTAEAETWAAAAVVEAMVVVVVV